MKQAALIVAIVVAAVLIVGCAAQPRLVPFADQADRDFVIAQCELEGCYLMPVDTWRELLKALRAAGIRIQ